jgi:hypothetical protein
MSGTYATQGNKNYIKFNRKTFRKESIWKIKTQMVEHKS